jgi:hypothetical protein
MAGVYPEACGARAEVTIGRQKLGGGGAATLGLVVAVAGWVAGSTALVRPAAGASSDLAPERQVLILSRALAYDGNLKERAGGELVVAVLVRPGHGDSEAVGAGMTRAWKALGSMKVQGLTVKAVNLQWTGAQPLLAALTGQAVDVLYVAPGLEPEIAAIIAITRQRRIITMGSREAHVTSGLSLGVFITEGKPTIVVNLPAARAEGAAFAADLLRLAKVIK